KYIPSSGIPRAPHAQIKHRVRKLLHETPPLAQNLRFVLAPVAAPACRCKKPHSLTTKRHVFASFQRSCITELLARGLHADRPCTTTSKNSCIRSTSGPRILVSATCCSNNSAAPTGSLRPPCSIPSRA